MKLIDKDALVAEIERRLWLLVPKMTFHQQRVELEKLLAFIDTLEVREVDIEDVVHGTVDYPLIGYDFPNIYPNYKELKEYCDKKGIKDNDKVKLIINKDI